MIIPKLGRKHPKMIALITLIYTLLILGGVTMVVPFMITVTGALSNSFDIDRYAVYPHYLFSDEECYCKFLAEKYNGIRFEFFGSAYGLSADWSTFRDLGMVEDPAKNYLPIYHARKGDRRQLKAITEDYKAFLEEYNPSNILPVMLRDTTLQWQRSLEDKYNQKFLDRTGNRAEDLASSDLNALGLKEFARTWQEGDYNYWDQVNLSQESKAAYQVQMWFPPDSPRAKDFQEFIGKQPPAHKLPITARYLWLWFLRGQNIRVEIWNQRMNDQRTSLYQLSAPGNRPTIDKQYKLPWAQKQYEQFHTLYWPMVSPQFSEKVQQSWTPLLKPAWHEFLAEQVKSVDQFNKTYWTSYTTLQQIPFPAVMPKTLADSWQVHIEKQWQAHLKKQFGSPDAVGKVLNKEVRSFEQVAVAMPGDKLASDVWAEIFKAQWQAFCKERFQNIEHFNKVFATNYQDLKLIPYPGQAQKLAHEQWSNFLTKSWRDFIKQRYPSAKAYNQMLAKASHEVKKAFSPIKSLDEVPYVQTVDYRPDVFAFAWYLYCKQNQITPQAFKTRMSLETDSLTTMIDQILKFDRQYWMVDLFREFHSNYWPLRLARMPDGYDECWQLWLRYRLGRGVGTQATDAKLLAEYNRLCGTDKTALDQIQFARTYPNQGEQRIIWLDFIRDVNEIQKWNLKIDQWKESDRSAPQPPMPKGDLTGEIKAKWLAVVQAATLQQNKAEGDGLMLLQTQMHSPESAYRQHLKKRYGTIEKVNAAYGWNYKHFDQVQLPVPEVDLYQYLSNSGSIFWGFLTNNFMDVIRYIAVRGNALPVTIIYVMLTIGFTLTVNPLAAYALSRFRLKYTQIILIYLLATMSFPPEVAMIPNFLLLRDFNLMNTFWALLLPGAANGYSIFLLKGFFDSLPQELYEAAELDGASEIRIFFQITMALSKPILSVITLWSFIHAYGSFLWPLLVCQDADMWTLMVWLYQFQQDPGVQPYQIMAGLIMASVPTLIVFLGCQKIILRGIILPTMK